MSFQVMARRCGQCLMDPPNRIVSSRRAAQILRECAQRDNSFLCHKGTMVGRDIACRGHYDTGVGQLARIAGRLGAVLEIDPETLKPAGSAEGVAPTQLRERPESFSPHHRSPR